MKLSPTLILAATLSCLTLGLAQAETLDIHGGSMLVYKDIKGGTGRVIDFLL